MSDLSAQAEPVTVDPADTPAVMAALGFPDGTVQAVVLTSRGALGISADYPPTPEEILAGPPQPPPVDEPVDPAPEPPQEATSAND